MKPPRHFHPPARKVWFILAHGVAEKVDAYDDLPAIIKGCTEWLGDPWVPPKRREMLRVMLAAAYEKLIEVQAGQAASGGSSSET